MSVEAYTWALNLAPVPNDPSGRPSPTCTLVLVALANHAYPDGTGAFPSVETMVRYTRLSERAVRLAIRRLEEHGTIRRGRQAVVAAHIDRSDRHPVCYDLAVEKMRDDLTDKQLDAIAASAPMLRGFIALARGAVRAADAGSITRPGDGGHLLHPVAVSHSTGGNSGTDGVQLRSPRGAPAAPKPSLEPPTEPTTTSSRRSRGDDEVGQPTTPAEEPAALLVGEPVDPGTKRKVAPHPLPEDFALTPAQQASSEQAVREAGVTLDLSWHWQQFLDHHHGKGDKWSDWYLSWRKWLRTAIRSEQRGSYGRPGRPAYQAPKAQNSADDVGAQVFALTGRGQRGE